MSIPEDDRPAPTAGTAAEDQYAAEAAVNLRQQRLRPATAEPSMRLRPPTTGPGSASADRYGVGAQNLATTPPTAAELEELREERLRRLLGAPPGVETDPAQWGWRGRANLLGARLRPSAAEIAHRLDIERIRQPLPGTPVITVANPKGGSGVTPAVLMLAHTIARHRGHGVVAWDNHETRGTLAARAAQVPPSPPTTWDLLAHARDLCSPTVVASAVARFLLPQPTGDEILASDQSALRHEMIGADECTAILAVLHRHRSIVIADTGNSDRAPAFLWAVEHATQLVVPMTYRRDHAHAALRMLDGLAARGYDRLVQSAVIVLADGTAADPPSREAVHEALARADLTRVVHVPFDPTLAGGERIVYTRLPPPTVRAWTHVAAVVADGVADELAAAAAPLHTDITPRSRAVPREYDTRRPDPGPRRRGRSYRGTRIRFGGPGGRPDTFDDRNGTAAG
ncbi:MinD/ParA family ATP-binding protein [Nocardia sp. alder85J]|uniref:MinD/ParA family ATP-binding protein n=1 Tax=Nocardia sp. alder85J TaxID=2862949 RepID=UPI001CD376FE|nr:hypothetical protein [Nocardia sp. alder85J]MCX4097696.1 hypothetical protein [Nocardia sp. alder85J]